MAEGIGGAFLEFMPTLAKNALSKLNSEAAKAGGDAGKKLGESMAAEAEKGAKKASETVNAKLREIKVPEINLNVDTKTAIANIEAAKKKLEELGGKSATASVRIQTQEATKELDALARKLGDVGKETEKTGGSFKKGSDNAGVFATQLAIMGSKAAIGGAGIAAAVPTVLNLTAAVLPATGALLAYGAGLAALKVVSGVVKLAVNDVGEAIGTAFGDDAKKAKEALAALPPEAQKFAKSVVGLKDELKGLQTTVSDQFFAPINRGFGDLANKALPAVSAKLPPIASAVGNVAAKFVDAATKGKLINDVSGFLDNVAGAVTNAGSNVGKMTDAIGALIRVAGQSLPGLSKGFGDLTGRVSDFITKAADTGKLAEFMNKGIDTVKTLIAIVVNLGKTFATVLAASQSHGNNLLKTIESLTKQVADFVRSAQGTSTLAAAFKTLDQIGAALKTSLGAALPAIAESAKIAAPVVADLASVAADLVKAVAPLLPYFTQLAAALTRAVLPAIESLSKFLAENTTVGKVLATTLGAIVLGMKAYGAATKVAAVAQGVYAAAQGTSLAATNASTIAITANKVAMAAMAAGSKVAAAATTLFNVALRANPIGIVVTAITALVAILVVLYQKNETVRKIIDTVWAAIKTAMKATVDWFVNTAWPALKKAWDAIQPAVQAVGKAISVAWDAIKKAIEVAWNAIKVIFDAIVKTLQSGPMRTAFDAYKAYLQVLWTAISTIIKNAWEVIKGVFTIIAAFLKGDFKGAWEALVTMITNVWKNIQTAIQNVWNAIKNTIFGDIIRYLGGQIKSAWDTLKTAVETAWNAIKSVISTVWSGVKTVLDGAANFIRTVFGPVFTWLYNNIVKPMWEAIKLAIQVAWVAIQIIFKSFEIAIKALGLLMQWLYNSVVKPTWEAIKTFISTTWNAIKTTVFDAWQTYIKGPFTAMWNAFKSFLETLWNAIKTFLTTTWNAIKTGVFIAWETYIKGPFTLMWNTFKTFFMTLWNALKTFLMTTWTAIKTTIFDVWSNYIKGPFTAMWNAFKAFFTALWTAIKTFLMQTWTAIKTTIFDVWSNYIKGPFTAMWNAFKSFLQTLWNAIKTLIAAAWTAIRGTFNSVIEFLRGTFTNAWNTFKNTVNTVWNNIKTILGNAWNWIKSNVFNPIGTFLSSTLPGFFSKGVSAIGSAWDKLRDVARKPVEFVVNTIIRDGIVKGFNAVATKVGVSPIQFSGMALGGVWSQPTKQSGVYIHAARGAVLPGYTPGRDVHRFVSPTGGVLDLSGGEAVMRPEFTRAIGPKAVDSLNAAARSGGVAGVARSLGLASGGVIGDGVGGKVKAVASTLWEGITGIGNPITGIVNGLIGKIPAAGWMLDLMKNTVTTLVSGVGKTITSWVGGGGGSSAGGGAKPGTAGGPGGWASMWNWVKTRFPSAQLYSGYRNSRTLSGNLSLHASGRAIDITPNRAISDAIISTFGTNITELISPWPSDHYWHGKKHTYSRAIQAQHGVFGNNAHIHWAMKNGGLFKPGKFDSGGWLEPGTTGVNLGHRPEAVLTPEESAGLKNMGVGELVDKLDELIDAVEQVAPGVGRFIRGNGRGIVAGGRSI